MLTEERDGDDIAKRPKGLYTPFSSSSERAHQGDGKGPRSHLQGRLRQEEGEKGEAVDVFLINRDQDAFVKGNWYRVLLIVYWLCLWGCEAFLRPSFTLVIAYVVYDYGDCSVNKETQRESNEMKKNNRRKD